MNRCVERLLPRTCAVAVIAALGACATNPSAELANLPGTEACFWTRSIFNWTALDESTLIVDAPTSRSPYLVKLMGPVPGLDASERVGFVSGQPRSGMFCSTSSSVFIRGPGAGGLPRYEPAIAVRALTPAQARDMILTAHEPQAHRQWEAGESPEAGRTPVAR